MLFPTSRNALIAAGVVLMHAAALWALQTGLLRRAIEVVVPVQVLDAALVTPPAPAPVEAPKVEPPQERPQPRTTPAAPRPVVRKEPPRPPPAPLPTAVPEAPPAPTAITGTPAPQPAPPPVSTPVAPPPAVAAPAPPAPPARVELPISDADYLHNPPPKWPRLSERLGEKGRVVVRVLIGTDGRAKTAHVRESSGFQRLDNASVEAALAWRYVPGKRGGVPEEMWVNVPIRWGE